MYPCDDALDGWEEASGAERVERFSDVVEKTLIDFGYEGINVSTQEGLYEEHGSPAEFDPETNTIFVDPEYLGGAEVDGMEGVYLAMHESLHAIDVLEDGELNVGEGDIAYLAMGMQSNLTNDCVSDEYEWLDEWWDDWGEDFWSPSG